MKKGPIVLLSSGADNKITEIFLPGTAVQAHYIAQTDCTSQKEFPFISSV